MAFGANANKTMRAISKMVALISRQKMSALRRMLTMLLGNYLKADTIVRALNTRSAEPTNRRISRNREGGQRGSGNQCDLHSATILKPKLTIEFTPRGMSSASLSATTAKASRRSMSAAMSSPLLDRLSHVRLFIVRLGHLNDSWNSSPHLCRAGNFRGSI